MKQLIHVLLFVGSLAATTSCSSQHQPETTPRLIGTCEGCEAVLEADIRTLSSVDTLPDFNGTGTNIKVTGQVFESGTEKPASGVILYIYHTDQNGRYTPSADPIGWEEHHGAIRGWIKTDAEGRYTFYTLRPAPYPNREEAAHIHITLLEPDGKYYWLDSYYFADDPLLTKEEWNNPQPRGGFNKVLTFKEQEGILTAEADIRLGANIPNYPEGDD